MAMTKHRLAQRRLPTGPHGGPYQLPAGPHGGPYELTPQARCRRGPAARRGVLLLVILGLLAIFGLVAVAFVVLTGQARRSSEALRRVEQTTDPPKQLLDDAFAQVLRGTNNPASVIGPHSLLETMYGNDARCGQISSPAPPAPPDLTLVPPGSGQLIEFTVKAPTASPLPGVADLTAADAAKRVGCVLTILDGRYAGCSTRIVAYDPVNNRLQIVATEEISATTLRDDVNTRNQTINYVVNGVPFSGTGFGLNTDPASPSTRPMGELNAVNALGEYALLPNPASFPTKQTDPGYNQFYSDPAGPGGANSDYTAVDYQHMLLAMLVPPLTNNRIAVPIPSLHRPELARFWVKKKTPAADFSDPKNFGAMFLGGNVSPELKRKITLRPLVEDNPEFTGSNPRYKSGDPPYDSGFNPLWDGTDKGSGRFAWDVDNDGDGVPDSIWVDLGMPARSTSDGRLYKPLFAILCTDLDGRLNLNAHGCLVQTDPAYYQTVDASAYRPSSGENLRFAGGLAQAPLARGQGYGPAEINLNVLFGNNTPNAQYVRLLQGNGTLEGRYGELGGSSVPGPGLSDAANPLWSNKWFPYAGNYWSFITGNYTYWDVNAGNYVPDAFGSPPDFFGKCALGLDIGGRPIYWAMGDRNPLNNPYEFNLSRNAAWRRNPANQAQMIDNPFTPAELERVLRPFDADAGLLPARLERLANWPVDQLRDRRTQVTSESWDVPCAHAAVPMAPATRITALRNRFISQLKTDLATIKGLPQGSARDWYTAWLRDPQLNAPNAFAPAGLADLLAVRLYVELRTQSSPVVPADIPAAVTANIPRLLPPDVLAGLRMDVNRPFGNGRANALGVVDAPKDLIQAATLDKFQQFDVKGNPLDVDFDPSDGLDLDGSGTADQPADRVLVRQAYARYLYVMAMLLVDDWVDPGWPTQFPGLSNDEARARVLAQWAVNVVDFRDRDSIITPFEYDVNPFRSDDPTKPNVAWNVDGRIGTSASPSPDDSLPYRGLVWGCERPELLISETLAFHDRRTQDLNTDSTGKYYPEDTDYDQQYRPQGSLFVELYNPWTRLDAPAGDLYTNGGVDLKKTAGSGAAKSPVWRMIIVDPLTGTPAPDADPDDPVPANRPTIERSVYFVAPGGNVTLPNDGSQAQQYYPSNTYATKTALIRPGRYAVIGPGETGAPNPTTTYIGFRSNQSQGDIQTRRIVLTPDLDPEKPDQVQVLYNKNGANNDLPAASIQAPVAVVVDQPHRLSISEPTGTTSDPYYPANGPDNQPYDAASGKYGRPFDSPLDLNTPRSIAVYANGTTPQFRVVHLQRLANPLEAHDVNANPYLTVDAMAIDLTAFNGVPVGNPDPASQESGLNTQPYHFVARERGELDSIPPRPPDNLRYNLWAHERTNRGTPPDSPPNISNHRFNEGFAHTLGYLNAAYGSPLSTPVEYKGDPQNPFPWLTWNNRPFVSPLELLLVPALSQSQLLRTYSLSKNTSNPYHPGAPDQPDAAPFLHLVNFFSSVEPDQAATGFSQLHRVLEFLRVPSRFVGTEVQAKPDVFAGGTGHVFHPPFNGIPCYREPGRINLNTIFSEDVWRGLMNYFPDATSAPANGWRWGRFVWSRRGYKDKTAPERNLLPIDPKYPTRFENPFRSYAGAWLVPPVNDPIDLKALIGYEINATLLRVDPNDTNKRTALLAFDSNNAYNNADRNPYFRYQGLQRLANLVTTRSNVYAVWITVGYFEVKPGAVDPVHPDGYRLGQELGMDTGQVTRHRAFYILDRTIPVGFMRGHDLNAEQAVLLKRFIE